MILLIVFPLVGYHADLAITGAEIVAEVIFPPVHRALGVYKLSSC